MAVLDHQTDGSYGFAPARLARQSAQANQAADQQPRYRAPRFRAAQIAGGQFAAGALAGRHQSSTPLVRSKIWFAFSLAILIYAVGAAGIWSIYQTFEASSSITPVKQTIPALPAGEPDDLRDAHLQEESDGHHPFRPTFRTPI